MSIVPARSDGPFDIVHYRKDASCTGRTTYDTLKSMAKSQKVKWKQVVRWKGLSPHTKLVALILLGRSDKEGWANVSPGEIAEQAGFPDNRPVNKAIKELEKIGALQSSESDSQYSKLYRLHNSPRVFSDRKI